MTEQKYLVQEKRADGDCLYMSYNQQYQWYQKYHFINKYEDEMKTQLQATFSIVSLEECQFSTHKKDFIEPLTLKGAQRYLSDVKKWNAQIVLLLL